MHLVNILINDLLTCLINEFQLGFIGNNKITNFTNVAIANEKKT